MNDFIKEILSNAQKILENHDIEAPRLNAELILEKVLNITRQNLILNQNNSDKQINISKEKVSEFNNLIEKRSQGFPIQYILGEIEFYNQNFLIDKSVLIPRPETEFMVNYLANEQNIKYLNSTKKLKILDMGTGSGIIGLSLAKIFNNAEVHLADISKKALEIAKKNAQKLNLTQNTKFINSNLFSNITEKNFNLITANLPYISEADMLNLAPELQHEPNIALYGGKTGIDIIQSFLNKVKKYIIDDSHNSSKKINGLFMIEYGYNQTQEIVKILRANNIKRFEIIEDLNGIQRFVIGSPF